MKETASKKEKRESLISDISFHKERINKASRMIQASLHDSDMMDEHTEFTVRFSELMEYLYRMVEKLERNKDVEL